MCIGPNVRFMPMIVSQKCHLPSLLVERVAEDLRPPVVEAAQEAEQGAAEDHVVEVGDDVVGVGLLGVDRATPAWVTPDRPPMVNIADQADGEQHRPS